MRSRFQRWSAPSLLLVVCALVLALGGSAVADRMIHGSKILRGTITGVQIKDGTVAPRDIHPKTFSALKPGPVGPRGPRGYTGPKGDPGTAGFNSYELHFRDIAVGYSHQPRVAQVSCPDTHVALGGGWTLSGAGASSVSVSESGPFLGSNQTGPQVAAGWRVVAKNPGRKATVRVWATCAKPN